VEGRGKKDKIGHGELHIGMVSTNDDVRGEGVADALLGRTLADADPGSTVFSGYKTDEGAG
jgi:predicted GNAT family acetyltransferase